MIIDRNFLPEKVTMKINRMENVDIVHIFVTIFSCKEIKSKIFAQFTAKQDNAFSIG